MTSDERVISNFATIAAQAFGMLSGTAEERRRALTDALALVLPPRCRCVPYEVGSGGPVPEGCPAIDCGYRYVAVRP